MADKLEVIAAIKRECSGADKDGKPVFQEKEPVIVKIYKSGGSEPLCRYLEADCVAPRCNPELRQGLLTKFTEDDLGVCPYSSKN